MKRNDKMKNKMKILGPNALAPIGVQRTSSSLNGNGNGHYGCRDIAVKANAIVNREIVVPELDCSGIRTTAIAMGRAGESVVRETSSRAFGAANNEHVEEMHGILPFIEDTEKGAHRHIKEISGGMNPEGRYIHTNKNGTPMTKADRTKLWFFVVLSAVVLGIGVNTNATVLRASGIRAFENGISAYLFSAIPIALAACLKALATHIEDPGRRRVYTVGVWGIGFLFGTAWAFLFASTFPGLTQSTADLVRSLTEAGAGTRAPESNVSFIFVAIMSETFLAAGAWLTAHAIAEKHELEEITDNPAHLKRQSDLDYWTKVYHDTVQIRGLLTGKLRRIEDESRCYVEKSVNYFRAALKASADSQRLDDFLGS
jgi:hypothetical protein